MISAPKAAVKSQVNDTIFGMTAGEIPGLEAKEIDGFLSITETVLSAPHAQFHQLFSESTLKNLEIENSRA